MAQTGVELHFGVYERMLAGKPGNRETGRGAADPVIRAANGMVGPAAGVCLQRDRNMTLGEGIPLPATRNEQRQRSDTLRRPATCSKVGIACKGLKHASRRSRLADRSTACAVPPGGPQDLVIGPPPALGAASALRLQVDWKADFEGRALPLAGLEVDLALECAAQLPDNRQTQTGARDVVAGDPLELPEHTLRV